MLTGLLRQVVVRVVARLHPVVPLLLKTVGLEQQIKVFGAATMSVHKITRPVAAVVQVRRVATLQPATIIPETAVRVLR